MPVDQILENNNMHENFSKKVKSAKMLQIGN